MRIIEDWIDQKLTSLVSEEDGYIILTKQDIKELKGLLGMEAKDQAEEKDLIYYMIDQHREYFLEKMEEYSQEYEEQQRVTNEVMQCQ